MCSFIQEAKTICENHSSNTHDKAKAESRGAPVFLPALAITDLAARALCPRAQLPFPGSCPHHPHSVSILLPTFLFIKRLLDVSKYCRQACFVWFCFVGEVLTVLVRCIAPIRLFCPQKSGSLAGLRSHRVSLEIQRLTSLPPPQRTAAQAPGPRWPALDISS